jgi:hypothetical protein
MVFPLSSVTADMQASNGRHMKFKKTIVTLCAVFLITGTYLGLKYYMEQKIGEEVDRQIAKLSTYADVRYGKLGFGLLDRRIRIQNLQISPRFLKDRIRVEELILDQSLSGEASPGVESISIESRGIRIDPFRNGSLEHLLNEIGYKEGIDLNLSGSVFYDKKDLVAGIRRFRLQADRAGSLELRLRLENFNPDHIQDIPENAFVLLTMLSAVYFADAELVYRDDSLLQRLYEAGARRTDQSAESFRRMLAERVQETLGEKEDPRVEKLVGIIHDFILSPGALHIQAKPKKPVPLLSLLWNRSPGKLIELLGLEAKIDPQITRAHAD